MDCSSQEYIQELLQPLKKHQASEDYYYQYQSFVDFDRSIRALEARYADLYEQVLNVEKNLSIPK